MSATHATRLKLLLVTLSLMGFSLSGCLPRTTVVSDPGPKDRGIRFYRPKPYLFVRPAEGAVAGSQVTIELQYLPDFSEEYSIHVRSGFGVNNTSITLEEGWNLVAIDQELDSRIAEQISAIGDVLDSVGNIVPTAKKSPPPQARMVVPATNVPLGFYESVIGRGPGGAKRLYGWRYVGFAPFQSCPLDSAGAECRPCETAFLYGLIFRNGVMTFEPLSEIGIRDAGHVQIRSLENVPVPLPQSHQALATRAIALLSEQLEWQFPAEAIRIKAGEAPTQIQLEVALPAAQAPALFTRYQTQAAEIARELDKLARELLLDTNAQVTLTWRTIP